MSNSAKASIRPYVRSARNLRNSIVRNRDDNDFAQAGGEIVYVFDTNVFIFFADMADNNRISRDFHSLIGRNSNDPLARVIERLTADFLFSGKLPGQSQRGFISVPHFDEVLQQTQRVAKNLKQGGRKLERSMTHQQRRQLQSVLDSNEPVEKRLAFLGQILPAAWLSNINAKAHFTAAVRKSFLDDGGALVPLDRHDWGRAAMNCTLAQIEAWGTTLPQPPRRNPISVRDDAMTLQTLVNLNLQQDAGSKRRYVFVTADEELEQAVEARIAVLGVPNFIRSPRDYLPIINLRAMTNALGRHRVDPNTGRQFENLFNKLNNALDWIVLPDDGAMGQGTELADTMRKIKEAWIEASQSAAVLNAYHMADGADDIFRQVADFVDEAGGKVATTLVDRSVEEPRRRHVALVLGSALSDLSLVRQGRLGKRARRVGLQLIGDLFGDVTGHHPINDFLDAHIGAGRLPQATWDHINDQTESYEVQLLACSIFVAAERWSAGIDFGTRAWKAAKADKSAKRTEAAYILALCLRFSMHNSNQLDQAQKLLESNLKSYSQAHETGPIALLRRVRDKMELGNLLLTASVTQELAKTPSGKKLVGSKRLDLFKGSSSNILFDAGVRNLVDAREELLDSEGLGHNAGSTVAGLAPITRWLKTMSATNIVGAFVFERVVEGLQLSRPVVSTCHDELAELDAELLRKDAGGEPVRPTQVIYRHAARAIIANNTEERIDALSGLEQMLHEIGSDLNKLPIGDQLEFAHLRSWLEQQRLLDLPSV